MNTYCYNINGERKYTRANTLRSAWWKVFYGELNKNGSVDMKKIDLKQVNNPRRERSVPGAAEVCNPSAAEVCNPSAAEVCNPSAAEGNKVFNNLRHI